MGTRVSETLPAAGHAALGDHICMPYDGPDEFRAAVTDYFTAGIKAGERIGFFAPSPKIPELTVWLAAAGFDMNRLAGDGQIVVGDVTSAYMPDGTFDPDRRIASYSATIQEALDDGFSGLRVVGDVATIMDMPGVRPAWAGYEIRADLLASTMPFTAICSYDRRICPPEAVEEATSVHSRRLGSHPPPHFRVVAAAGGGIAIEGEIDFATADMVRRVASEAAMNAEPRIDVSRLAFIDAAGIRAVALAARQMTLQGAQAEIAGASRMFRRLWELMGLERLNTIRVS